MSALSIPLRPHQLNRDFYSSTIAAINLLDIVYNDIPWWHPMARRKIHSAQGYLSKSLLWRMPEARGEEIFIKGKHY